MGRVKNLTYKYVAVYDIGCEKIKPNIIWITLDAARKDRLSCYGYERDTTPFLDELSKDSLLFENFITNSTWTLPSVGSMFTGKYPSENGIINTREDKINYPTIAEILSDKGYNTVSYGGNPFLYSTDLKNGFDEIHNMTDLLYSVSTLPQKKFSSGTLKNIYEGINQFLTLLKIDKDPTAWGSTSPIVREAVKKNIHKMEEPYFLYLHMTETHLICDPPLSYQKFGKKKLFLPQFLGDHLGVYSDWFEKKISLWAKKDGDVFTDEELKIISNAYDNTLYHVDFQLRLLYDYLRENGFLEDTILIITADHGEMLGEEGDLAHMFSFREPLIHIPLIIHGPDIGRGKIDDLIEAKDIFNIVMNLSEGKVEDFWSSTDYVYGEWKAIPEHGERVKEKNPEIFTEAEYLRTKKAKYIEYDNGEEALFGVDGEEKRLDNPELKKAMKEMLEIKRKSVEKNKRFDVLDDD